MFAVCSVSVQEQLRIIRDNSADVTNDTVSVANLFVTGMETDSMELYFSFFHFILFINIWNV